ncbi:MAG TPA: hypothetical protein VJ764_06270 [Steroidobacteraceae bacterium]|nr:hypothetical protein [Steroidobacteraceae bacterium]
MTPRIFLIVAVAALAGSGGFWFGTRHALVSFGDALGTDDPASVDDSTGQAPNLPSFPPAGVDSEARFEALAVEPVDDPKPALKKALGLSSDVARRQQLTRIGWAWARTSPEEAWREAERISDPAARFQFQSAIVAAWASEQPERAFAGVASMPADWQREQLLRQVTTELVRRDPRLALELLTTVDVSDQNAFHALVADEWARFDPAGAGQWIESLERRKQARLAYEIADAYVAQQPGEALAWALRISRSPGRNLWSHMVGLVAQQDPQEALRLARSADNPAQRSQAMGAVLSTIAAQDPGLAISYLEDLPAGPQRTQTAVRIAMQMAETSPENAIDWIGNLPDRQARSQGLVELGSRLAWEDVDAAARMIEHVPDEMRNWWITTVARSYVAQDVDQGIQWVRRFENDPGYELIVQQFAGELAVRSPDAALELVERTASGRKRDEMLADMVMQGAGKQSPEVASRWVAKISDDDARARAVEYLASTWGQYDAAGARKWVMSQPVGAVRDRGLTQLAITTTSNANDALGLIDQIQSREQRMSAVLQTAVRLHWSNPEEARTLLRRYPLDPLHQQQLDQMLQQQDSARRR